MGRQIVLHKLNNKVPSMSFPWIGCTGMKLLLVFDSWYAASLIPSIQPEVNLLHPLTSMKWSEYGYEIPVGMYNTNAAVLENKVYIGGRILNTGSTCHLSSSFMISLKICGTFWTHPPSGMPPPRTTRSWCWLGVWTHIRMLRGLLTSCGSWRSKIIGTSPSLPW